jgi:hypothetical protein
MQTIPVTTIGPVGVAARVAVGLTLIALEFAWRDPKWQDAPLGLVVLPALVVVTALLWSRRSSRPLRAIGPVGHSINAAVFIALAFVPATAGAAFLFYGGSMLIAAARRDGGCEVTAISNALLRRDDAVGCMLFAPVDLAERALWHAPARDDRARPR